MRNKTLAGVLVLAVAALLGGCQTAGGLDGKWTQVNDKRAVFISAGNGQTVVIPTTDGTKVISSADKMCETCMKDAMAYFTTGKLEEKCGVCGASRTIGNAR